MGKGKGIFECVFFWGGAFCFVLFCFYVSSLKLLYKSYLVGMVTAIFPKRKQIPPEVTWLEYQLAFAVTNHSPK